MRRFGLFSGAVLLVFGTAVVALAQGPPPPPPPCEEQLNNKMYQAGLATQEAGMFQQELAKARAQLDAVTKDRDTIKAALAKLTPKPEEKK